ncbi:hypothetical protein ABTY96_03100 [Streptomyces sp. NPDC096057]|uniref:hypothetical protein n=1 Tax=Streptomyces sp. NPDC096057 TaxID=3155543 RepID=UPI00332E6973
MNMYDIRDGIRINDKAAMSFEYDPRPVVAGEAGAGTLVDTPENMLNDADRNHMAALNTFREKKGMPILSDSEYLAYMA